MPAPTAPGTRAAGSHSAGIGLASQASADEFRPARAPVVILLLLREPFAAAPFLGQPVAERATTGYPCERLAATRRPSGGRRRGARCL
jgi:hypothetical protein